MTDQVKRKLPKTDAMLGRLKAEKGEKYVAACWLFLTFANEAMKSGSSEEAKEQAASKMAMASMVMGFDGFDPDQLGKDATELAMCGLDEIHEQMLAEAAGEKALDPEKR